MTKESFAYLAGAASTQEAARAAREVSLRGHLRRLRGRALVVHGGRDQIAPARNAELITSEIGAKAELWLEPEGNHSCNNLHTTIRPAIADWVADALAARR